MTENKESKLGGIVAGATGTLVVLLVGGIIYVYSGAYNITATEEHSSVVRWAIDTTFRRSVASGADGVRSPEELTPSMAAAGAAPYKQMCQHCHAGSGVERESWSEGMRPRPPHLVDAAAEWEPAEVFWLVKNGAKMTGMPAFGPTHSDEDIWNIVAFVKQLPAMAPEDYASSGRAADSDAVSTPAQP